MSIASRAAVVDRKDAPFVIRPVVVEEPRADEVLVRMVATGICATDAHVQHQLMPAPLPAILGHEGAGVVERVGSTVTHVEPGDHVVLSYHSCGHCKSCASAHAAYCDRVWDANFAGARLDGTSGVRGEDGESLHAHFFGQSSFSTYALAHARNTIKVARDVPLDILGPLGCGFQTGAGAVLKALDVGVGASIAVFGVGAVGLAAIMAARVADAMTIVAVDVNPEVYGSDVEIIGHEITKELLERFPDPKRPVPTLTFDKAYTLVGGGVTLELSYKGENHCPGNIFIWAPAQKVLTVIDIISPGSATFMHCDASQNISGWYEAQAQLMEYDFDFLVAGHHMSYGTPDTVKASIEYFADVLEGAQAAIDRFSRSDVLIDILIEPGLDKFWVGTENWINSMTNFATKHVLEKRSSNGQLWSERLAGVTTQTKYHAYTVLESIRLERNRPNYRLKGENPPPFYA